MDQNFLPPPQAIPNFPNQPNLPGQPNLNNSGPRTEGRVEAMGEMARSVARSAKIKKAVGAVIKTRSQFKEYLKQNGLDLFTSAIEFQGSGDFIASSYVTYPNHQNFMEPLVSFLQRYPSLQAPVIAIRDQLRPVQNHMTVLTPKLSNPNPFENFNDNFNF